MELQPTTSPTNFQQYPLPYQFNSGNTLQVTYYKGVTIKRAAKCDKCGHEGLADKFPPAFSELRTSRDCESLVILCWTCWNNY